MAEGARLTGLSLLPPKEQPFDRLHAMHGEEMGRVIEDLHQTIEDYLRQPDASPHFGIELLRTFRVNTRWDAARAANRRQHPEMRGGPSARQCPVSAV